MQLSQVKPGEVRTKSDCPTRSSSWGTVSTDLFDFSRVDRYGRTLRRSRNLSMAVKVQCVCDEAVISYRRLNTKTNSARLGQSCRAGACRPSKSDQFSSDQR